MSAAYKCDVCKNLFEKTGYFSHVYLGNVCIVLACGKKPGAAGKDLEDADVCRQCLAQAAKQLAQNLNITPLCISVTGSGSS